MPKVTTQYLADKKNYILECTGGILKEKPLYLITMRDIIKKADFSQGVIYRYYTSIDEIYVDYINKHTTHSNLEQSIDSLLSSERTEKNIVTECFLAMGDYIEELIKCVVGKTFFELMVLYAYDFEKRAAIFPNLKFKQSLEYAQQKIVGYIKSNIEKGNFHPQIPVNSIIQFVSCFIDGIAQSMTIKTADVSNRDLQPSLNIPEMFLMLAKAVNSFLEV